MGDRRTRFAGPVGALALTVLVSGCVGSPGLGKISTTTQHGYVVSQIALDQVPIGSSKDQVLIALGSPSTTGDFGGEAFYYISQTRKQPVKFMAPRVVGQRVLAVYFDKDDKVTRIADYGIKDGKVFDFITRTTPTGGADQSFLRQVLGGMLGSGLPSWGK